MAWFQAPPTTTTLYTSSHHLSLSPSTIVSHGAPETEPLRSVSVFLGPSPLLPRVCVRRAPTTTTTLYTSSHHLSPSPPTVVSHGAPKTERSRSVSVFLGSSPLLPRVCERRAPPPPPYPPRPTTSPHRSSHTAPETEPLRSVLSDLAPASSSASRLRTQSPTTTTTSSTSSHHLTPSPSTAILHGVPETEQSRSVSLDLAPSPLSCLAFANVNLSSPG
ncbi:hypothetical protein PILCRDRAFT_11245 [Piloderma croceum F 1598]|uniref:Uncharacterized protein n=1 Tax=Piloderma croceum (strain F 1598) TaxID=765440 RepID=A0A0C3FEW6_PILCF|nr:hypothetical protein PILCRDRAFT_11245 [Piloderma croceum F 1598]